LNLRTLFLYFFFSLSLGLPTWAFDVPALTGPVVDEVGLLSSNTRNQLSQVLQTVHRNKGPQVQVFVTASLQGLSIEEAAVKIFEKWKLGGEKEDNGVLFLIAPNEKKLRIEVGYGLEGDIPDAVAKRIVSDVVVPYFKQKQFNAGITQGVQAILYYGKAQTDQGALAPVAEETPSEGHGSSNWIVFIIIGFWILLFIFNPSFALALLFSGRGGSGSSSGGGGGWSGGGGSSGGGGASGSW
jgi:uncharacterized protein